MKLQLIPTSTASIPARMHRQNASLLGVAILSALGSSAALAQTTPETTAPPPAATVVNKVERVILSASPFANQDELQATQPSAVVGREALTRDRAASLGDSLATQPGVQSSAFGPGASRPVIRGLDGPRIKTAENGVSTLDVATISPDHAVSTEVLGARQIEILRGPATLLYGSGAIGGLVNVVTDRIPQAHSDGTRLLADVRGSTAERTRDVGAQLRTSAGTMAFTGEFSDRRTGDYELAGGGKLANSDTATRNGSVGASWIFANGYIGVGGTRFQSQYGIPSADAPRIDLSRNRVEANGEFNDILAVERIRFAAASNNYRHAEIEATGDVGTVFSNNGTSARLDLQTRPLAGFRTVVGVDLERARFAAVGEETIVPATSTRSTALFAVTERAVNFGLGRGRIEIGGRIERVNHAPASAASLPSRGFSLGSSAIAYQQQLTESSSLTASFTHADRAPGIEELYSKGAHIATLTYDLGNAALAKEHSQNFDLSYKLQRNAWSVRASVFRNNVKDFIYGASVDANGDGVADYVDVEGDIAPGAELLKREFRNVNARFTGAEVSVAYSSVQGFGFTAMADTVRAIMTDPAGNSGNNNLPRVSPSRIGGKLTWRGGADGVWYADLGVTHVFAQERVAAFESATPGYTRVDASVRYRLRYGNNRHADLYLLGKNLGDRDIRVHTSFLKDVAPLAGRSFIFGVTAYY